jgi:4-amino-4-deoxy-L-arabinose transferase-like glycosyltransferase
MLDLVVREGRLGAIAPGAIVRYARASPPYLVVAWAVWLIARANFWAMTPVPVWLNQDESYIAALAYRMIEGQWLPYVDGVSHRGPVLYYVAALWLRAFGVTLDAVRALAFVSSASVAILVFVVGRAAYRPFVGAVAALVWVIASVGWDLLPGDGIAFNGELLANVFALGALACITVGLRDRAQPRSTFLFAGGLLASLGVLTKQTAIVTVLPFLIWVTAAAVARTEWRPRARAQWVLLFASGLCLPFCIICIRYAVAGELSTFWYYFVTYNRDVYMAPYRDSSVFERLGTSVAPSLPIASLMAALAVGFTSNLFRRRAARGKIADSIDNNGFALTLILQTVLVGLTVNAPMRGFGHYLLSLFPWTGLLAGHLLERTVFRATRHMLPATLMLIVLASAAQWGWSHQYGPRLSHSKQWPPVNSHDTPLCQYLHARTDDWDPVFVWGFYAEPYVSCRVSPATRYVYTTFNAGVVPWAESTLEEENDRAVSGSRTILLRELELSKPKIIVDAKGSLMGRSIRRYRELASYLDEHYCSDGQMLYGDLYVRKGSNRVCPSTNGTAVKSNAPPSSPETVRLSSSPVAQ